MHRVFIPPMLRKLTGGQNTIDVDGLTLREVVESMDRMFPGFQKKLCPDGQIRPGISVSVGDRIVSHGLASTLEPASEIHFLPALGGG